MKIYILLLFVLFVACLNAMEKGFPQAWQGVDWKQAYVFRLREYMLLEFTRINDDKPITTKNPIKHIAALSPEERKTLLIKAIEERCPGLVCFLIDRYPEFVKEPLDEQGNTVLHTVIQELSGFPFKRQKELIGFVVARIDINTKNTLGQTALHILVRTCPKLISWFLNLGANPNAVTFFTGTTPLMVAVDDGLVHAVQILLECKEVDPTLGDTLRAPAVTPLELVNKNLRCDPRYRGMPEIKKLLMARFERDQETPK